MHPALTPGAHSITVDSITRWWLQSLQRLLLY